MSYSTQQRIFSAILSRRNLHGESVAESILVNFPILLVPDKTMIYRLVKIINETGPVQNKKPQVNKRALIDDKLDEIGFLLEQIPQKSLWRKCRLKFRREFPDYPCAG